MKYLFLTLLLISTTIFASEAEKEAKSKITKATVFLSGAQVTRESNIRLSKGTTTLKFKELSPFIDKNSIKVSGIGNFTILSVDFNINHIEKTESKPETISLISQIEKLTLEVENKKMALNILSERKGFLSANEKVISSDKVISPNDFKLFKEIFSSDYESIQKSTLKNQRLVDSLNKEIQVLNKQVKEISSVKELPTSEITVLVSSKVDSDAAITLTYYLSNAGWFPSYDLRVENINSPVKLAYKANVYQNTGIDWNNIELTFSNASPMESAVLPTLNPYYLFFNNYPSPKADNSRYNPNLREVTGIIKDSETGEPIPFANVMIKDKTIGTTSDFDGKFSLSIPIGSKSLIVNYVGYESKEVTISNSFLDIPLNESVTALQEVVVTDYRVPLISRKDKYKKESEPIPVEMKTADYKTNFEFAIKIPYSISSKAGNLSIEMKEVELNTSYLYKTIPKLNPQAFLIANIVDWEQHSLLDGEVNLYFEKTFVGKSILDLSQLSDTLEVSLGVDKNITVTRNKQKEHTMKQFFGGNKIETISWKTIIRNNKSETIKIYVFDQIPISNNEEITVEPVNVSGGELNKETGEISWEIDLAPKETAEKTLEYKVKHPKKEYLRIE